MKAAYIENHGNLDQIRVGNLDKPTIRPNEVLVETNYAALNHLDVFHLQPLWSQQHSLACCNHTRLP